MTLAEFQADIRAGIPAELPALQPYDTTINHAPKRKDILTPEEKKLALRNALRYFRRSFTHSSPPSSPRSCASTVVSICTATVPPMR